MCGKRSEFRAPDLNFRLFHRCPVWLGAKCIIWKSTLTYKADISSVSLPQNCKSDYLNVCQKLSKFKCNVLQKGKAVFVHRPRSSIQKFGWGENPYAKIHPLLKDIWGPAEKCELCLNNPLLLQCWIETCYWGAKVWMLKSGVTLVQTTGFLPSGALQEEDAARSATVGVPLPWWMSGGALLSCLSQCRAVTWSTERVS